ncbi:long-chain-fatty-acid--CoA ligase [Pseudonocardia sp. UM4_GMWB1]
MFNLAVLLEHAAREFPDRDAVVLGDERLSYAQLDRATDEVARGLLARGVRPGDRVALTCPNVPAFPVAYYGVLKAGAVVVPLNVLLTAREIAFHLEDSGAKTYLCYEGTADLPSGRSGWSAFQSAAGCVHFVLIRASAPRQLEHTEVSTLDDLRRWGVQESATPPICETDTAVVLYTSGTTGKPKGAEMTHSNLVLNALLVDRVVGRHSHDVHLASLPLFHSFGQTVQMNAGFANGATIVLQPRFDAAEAFQIMRREKITVFAGVPTMFWQLLKHARERLAPSDVDHALRVCLAGGAPLPIEVLTGLERTFGVPILEGYGLSETSPISTFNRLDEPRCPGSVGRPVWGVEVRIRSADGSQAAPEELGEVCIRGHNVTKGYLNRPQSTADAIDAHGWFRTGDIGKQDAAGCVYIVDRSKEMIIRGGFNVYPREVEEVLVTHPAVSLAAVVGVRDEQYGEEVKAYVICESGAEIGEDELIAWCKDNLAAYKYPRFVEFRDTLPMTATGKILKRELTKETTHA